jgi:protein-disulfide isomerase
MPASLASEAAGEQGKFWEMHSLLFENYSDWTELNDPKPYFLKYATQIGLNTEKFQIDMASSTLESKISSSIDEAMKIGVNSTPTFFVNGKVIDNPQGYEAFKTLIETTVK